MAVKKPLSANDYDDRTTEAIKSVLIDIGQILGSFQGKFVVVGGAVPWLLLRKTEMPHIGTQDIDLCLRLWGTANTSTWWKLCGHRATDSGNISDAFNSCAPCPPAMQGPTSTSSSTF